MSKITYSIHHASMMVADTQRAINFYSGVLGLQQTERIPLPFPGAWFQLGEQQLHVLELESLDPTTGRPEHGGLDRHVALTVEELAPVKALLEKAGVKYSLSKSGRPALFCRDPDGNAIEVIGKS